jgi:hypothetical protein
LQPAVQIFCGAYGEVKARANTGNIAEDTIIAQAKSLYLSKEGKEFPHIEVWNVWKNIEKFSTPTSQKKKNKRKSSDDDEETEAGAIPNAYNPSANTEVPLGRDKAKRLHEEALKAKKREQRDTEIFDLTKNQSASITGLANILTTRFSAKEDSVKKEKRENKKKEIDVSLYHESVKMMLQLGNKKKAREMMEKIAKYQMKLLASSVSLSSSSDTEDDDSLNGDEEGSSDESIQSNSLGRLKDDSKY